jgi:hypothetical protein
MKNGKFKHERKAENNNKLTRGTKRTISNKQEK